MKTIKELKKDVGLHITTNHNGKMDGMQSLSTSPLVNAQCNRNCTIEGSICKGVNGKGCFSRKQTQVFPTMEKPLAKNYEILTTRVLSIEELPIINALYFRFEAFGDLASETQVINFFRICEHNPKTNFALWTKNPLYIKKAIQNGYTKPKNLNILYSSLFVNKSYDMENVKKRYPFIDKIFTVYDEKEAEDVPINCGARKCLKCRLCYEKNSVEYINELIKQWGKKNNEIL